MRNRIAVVMVAAGLSIATTGVLMALPVWAALVVIGAVIAAASLVVAE